MAEVPPRFDMATSLTLLGIVSLIVNTVDPETATAFDALGAGAFFLVGVFFMGMAVYRYATGDGRDA